MHNHRYVRTLRIRQANGLNNPTAATTSPSRDTINRTAATLARVFINIGGPQGPWRQAGVFPFRSG